MRIQVFAAHIEHSSDQDIWLLDQGSGNAQALLLATAEVPSVLADLTFVPFRKNAEMSS